MSWRFLESPRKLPRRACREVVCRTSLRPSVGRPFCGHLRPLALQCTALKFLGIPIVVCILVGIPTTPSFLSLSLPTSLSLAPLFSECSGRPASVANFSQEDICVWPRPCLRFARRFCSLVWYFTPPSSLLMVADPYRRRPTTYSLPMAVDRYPRRQRSPLLTEVGHYRRHRRAPASSTEAVRYPRRQRSPLLTGVGHYRRHRRAPASSTEAVRYPRRRLRLLPMEAVRCPRRHSLASLLRRS
jgi:hypothetical protein